MLLGFGALCLSICVKLNNSKIWPIFSFSVSNLTWSEVRSILVLRKQSRMLVIQDVILDQDLFVLHCCLTAACKCQYSVHDSLTASAGLIVKLLFPCCFSNIFHSLLVCSVCSECILRHLNQSVGEWLHTLSEILFKVVLFQRQKLKVKIANPGLSLAWKVWPVPPVTRPWSLRVEKSSVLQRWPPISYKGLFDTFSDSAFDTAFSRGC